MNKLAFAVFIVCLASASAQRSQKDEDRITKDKIRFRRCVLESCSDEYSNFRVLELDEKEKCYASCNPMDIDTGDKSIKKSERKAVKECLKDENCFDLDIKYFQNATEFQTLKACAELKCSPIEPKRGSSKRNQQYPGFPAPPGGSGFPAPPSFPFPPGGSGYPGFPPPPPGAFGFPAPPGSSGFPAPPNFPPSRGFPGYPGFRMRP